MSVSSILTKITLPTSLLFLASCQMTDLAQNPLVVLKSSSSASANGAKAGTENASLNNILSLKDAVFQATPKINVDAGFAKAVSTAVTSDPKVQMAKADVLQQQSRLGVIKSQLDFQFSGTVYAGVEDVTDETDGIAAVLSASKVMYDRAANHPQIEIKTFRQVSKWLSDDSGLTGAVLEDPRDGTSEEIAVTGAFIAIGHKPITAFLEGQIETDEEGYIVPKGHSMTSVSGIFAAGDVVDTRYRQAITAAGMGCAAAMDAERWLEENIH